MDIYTLNKATGIQDEIKSLKEEKDIWESATSFYAGTEKDARTNAIISEAVDTIQIEWYE